MKVLILLPFLVTLSEARRGSEVNLPDIPGPPYPDKFGHNKWGYKYEDENDGVSVENLQLFSPNRPGPPRTPWDSALRPFFSSRNRLSKSKLNRRQTRSNSDEELPLSISEIYASAMTTEPNSDVRYSTLNPQHDFFQQAATHKKGAFAKTLSEIYNDYKPAEIETSTYSTIAKENVNAPSGSRDSGSKSKSKSLYASATGGEEDDYPPAFERRPAPPPSRGPSRNYRERPLISGGSLRDSSSYNDLPRGPLSYSSPSKPSGSLSSFYDLYDHAVPVYPNGGSGRPSFGSVESGNIPFRGGSLYDKYFDSPNVITSTRGSAGFSGPFDSDGYSPYPPSTGPISSYSMPAPPPPPYSSSYDGFSPSPFPPGPSYSSRPVPLSYAQPFSPGIPVSPLSPASISISSPMTSVGYLPPAGVYIPPNSYPSPSPTPVEKPHKKLRRRKKRPTIHTVVRDMLVGKPKSRRPPPPDYREAESENKPQKTEPPANNNPFVVMPPPVTVVANTPQYAYPAPQQLASGRYPQPAYDYRPQPPPQPPAAVSQLAQSISTLRDAITGYRERPPRYYYPPPPPPPRPRPTPQHDEADRESRNEVCTNRNVFYHFFQTFLQLVAKIGFI